MWRGGILVAGTHNILVVRPPPAKAGGARDRPALREPVAGRRTPGGVADGKVVPKLSINLGWNPPFLFSCTVFYSTITQPTKKKMPVISTKFISTKLSAMQDTLSSHMRPLRHSVVACDPVQRCRCRGARSRPNAGVVASVRVLLRGGVVTGGCPAATRLNSASDPVAPEYTYLCYKSLKKKRLVVVVVVVVVVVCVCLCLCLCLRARVCVCVWGGCRLGLRRRRLAHRCKAASLNLALRAWEYGICFST